MRFIALAAVVAALVSGLAYAAQEGDLSYLARNGKVVKLYIKNISKDCESDLVSAEGFRKILEDSIRNRKSVKFEIVNSSGSSDMQMEGSIKKYLYSETDPITSYAGAGGLLLDAATVENYGEMTVDFTVIETKTGKVIWQKSIMAFKKGKMTPQESVPLVYDKVSRAFLSKSFGKPK